MPILDEYHLREGDNAVDSVFGLTVRSGDDGSKKIVQVELDKKLFDAIKKGADAGSLQFKQVEVDGELRRILAFTVDSSNRFEAAGPNGCNG